MPLRPSTPPAPGGPAEGPLPPATAATPPTRPAAVSRRDEPPTALVPVAATPTPPALAVTPSRDGPLPPRLATVTILLDDSGTMWRVRQAAAAFADGVVDGLTDRLAPHQAARVLDTVFVLYMVVSGGWCFTRYVPLRQLRDHLPRHTPDGFTPIGGALRAVADEHRRFVERAAAADVTVRPNEFIVISDCMPSGETAGETAAGVDHFLGWVKAARGKVTVVVPPDPADPAEAETRPTVNHPLAARLNVTPGRPLGRLDATDPRTLIVVVLESLIAMSGSL